MWAFLRQISNGIERADLGGWLPMVGGIALIALAVLLPAWQDLQQTRHQLDSLSITLTGQTEQLHRYHQLVVSVRHDDPMILQRLAWNELRLKPAGALVIGDPPADARMSPIHQQWVDARAQAPRHLHDGSSKLERLLEGSNRPIVLLVGAALIGFGLFTSLRVRPDAT